MKTQGHLISCLLALALLTPIPAKAQRGGGRGFSQPRANQGHFPPELQGRAPSRVAPELERMGGGRVSSMPHVNHDHWYGHDRPNDQRYRLGRPFEHGRFDQVGPSFRYDVARVDTQLHRFWLTDGYYFDVAAWDWPISADWCWNCGDDFVIYADPDHPGWYVVYNNQTGAFVHATYMGQ